jgi:hypothetical protein
MSGKISTVTYMRSKRAALALIVGMIIGVGGQAEAEAPQAAYGAIGVYQALPLATLSTPTRILPDAYKESSAGTAAVRQSPPDSPTLYQAIENVVRIEAEIGAFLDTPDEKSNLSSETLRKLAGRTQRAGALLEGRLPVQVAETHLHTVSRGRAIAHRYLPNETLQSPNEVSAVLYAAATRNDREAIRAHFAGMLALVRDGVYMEHAIPAADILDDLRPLESAGIGKVSDHIERLVGLLAARDRLLVEQAAGVLTESAHGANTSVYDLTVNWISTGPRRLLALSAALAEVGDIYVFGARGPDKFDCSGLTSYAWARGGVALRTSSFSQREQTAVSRQERDMRPGDLVFYERRREDGELTGHVALLLGEDGLIVEANRAAGGVRVARYETSPLWGFGQIKLPEEKAY